MIFGICVEIPIKMHMNNFNYTEISSYEYKECMEKNVNEFKDAFSNFNKINQALYKKK